MLMLLFTMISLMNLSFVKKFFWVGQNLIFLIFFYMIISMNLLTYPGKISYFLGVDTISYSLILLTLWIVGLMFMASEKIYMKNYYLTWFIFMLMFLLVSLFLTFSAMNLFMFYLFFESSMIPTFFLILGWGYQPERLQAGIYLLFYTLAGSLPLLLSILYSHNQLKSLNYYLLNDSYKFNLVYLCLIMAFLVKMPMFFLHMWLPKAHVEAPVAGSMILAGVLLKLGGYGLLRVYNLIQFLGMKFNLWFYVISLFGGVLISLVCLMQVDMKSLIAYSSVVHMGMVIGGLMTLSIWGTMGAFVLMIGHGLCSSGLFCLVNMVYERTSSRSMFINKGLMNFMPSLSLWWFLLLSSNMAAPPSLNLMGEIFLITSIISWSWLSMFLIMVLSFFSAVYSLYLYAISQQGSYTSLLKNMSVSSFRENLILILHWVPLNILVMKIDFCISWV